LSDSNYILATAGHVDHGKSALVTALTGIDPDRLPEEKARGITIDLGFALLPLARNDHQYSLGVVDVPGHEDFVRNMVAGIGSVDLALLVVAADDGWMPQTEEHLQILQYLGVKRAAVALTKADLLTSPAHLAQVTQSIRQRLANSNFADAPIVATSIPRQSGLDELRAALLDLLDDMTPPPDIAKPRLAVDRAFTLPGVGAIVTGTLAGGTLRKGQAVIVQPGGTTTRVRSIQSHGRAVESAGPGARVALNLPDLQPRTADLPRGTPSAGRGDVITLPDLGPATTTLDVLLHRSPRAAATARPLRDNARIHLHHGSAAIPARLCFLSTPSLAPGQSAPAQLRLDVPLFALAGDCLVIRDWTQQETLAGGIVLDPDASRRNARAPARRAFLAARAAQPFASDVYLTALLARDGALSRDHLGIRSTFPTSAIEAALADLQQTGTIVDIPPLIANSEYFQSLVAQAARAIDAHHLAHPEQPGLPLEQLRSSFRPDLFAPLLHHLTHDGFARTGAAVRRASHLPKLPPRLQQAGDRLRLQLSQSPHDPPSVNQLAPSDLARQALKFLLLSGEAVQLTPDLVLSIDALNRAADIVRDFIRKNGPATVSQLKTALSSSRRVMVPLLEKLDRDQITLRQGDHRILVPLPNP
jgi:selenocysteine-specific elongation factor